jgi:predicted metal-dependent hydrolase
VSAKSDRIAHLAAPSRDGWDGRYLGYFQQFNSGAFYEAHDILEDLWLAAGRASPDYSYFKGLIQLAGAFVHLRKDRLRPAFTLFGLARANLAAFAPSSHGIDVSALLAVIDDWTRELESDAFASNPLARRPAPLLSPPAHS